MKNFATHLILMFVMMFFASAFSASALTDNERRDIEAKLRPQITVLNFDFVPIQGSTGSIYHFAVDVVNGEYDAQFDGIIPGDYGASVTAHDSRGVFLFEYSGRITINAGQTTNFTPVLQLSYGYNFHFLINAPQGSYTKDKWYSVIITTKDGGKHSTHGMFTDAGLDLYLWLAWDDAISSISIADDNGNYHSTTVNYDFQYDIIPIVFTPPVNSGNVNVEIAFQSDLEKYVYCNDSLFMTIQEAIDGNLASASLDIYLGPGDYEGFSSEGKSIMIVGSGPDKTRINGHGTELIGKSTRPNWEFRDLTISTTNKEVYAIRCTAGTSLVIQNCVVIGGAYSQQCPTTINHCLFIGTGFFAADEKGVLVKNTIFTGTSVAIDCVYAVIEANNICVFGGIAYRNQINPAQQINIPGLITADPQVESQCWVAPTSPCVGTADDGKNIGCDPSINQKG